MNNNKDVNELTSRTKQTILFTGTMVCIDYYARSSTAGREFDMVTYYLNQLIEKYERLKRKRAAIFIEPQLDTGYPDIVIVEFYSIPKKQWIDIRDSINITDLRILYYIQTHGQTSISDLRNILGFPSELLDKTIYKLRNCKLITTTSKSNTICSVPLKSYCRISNIISIEAKIDKWSEAIRQASNNVWFSTKSYVLMNKDSCSNSILSACRESGVGIIAVNGKAKTMLESKTRRFPVSYASLQFNEWILRYLMHEVTK